MTNAQIIFNESIRLVEEQKIGTTGRLLTVVDGEGNEKTIPEPEPIHTFDEWKRMGLYVKRGEHAVAAFPIWVVNRKPVKLPMKDVKTGETVEVTEDSTRYVMKTAYFFAASQVSIPEKSENLESVPA